MKRPVVHVSFTYPRNLRDCCNCVDSDFLFVYVGLFNVLLLQFVVVVVLFFLDREVDISHLDKYYPGFYHGGAQD